MAAVAAMLAVALSGGWVKVAYGLQPPTRATLTAQGQARMLEDEQRNGEPRNGLRVASMSSDAVVEMHRHVLPSAISSEEEVLDGKVAEALVELEPLADASHARDTDIDDTKSASAAAGGDDGKTGSLQGMHAAAYVEKYTQGYPADCSDVAGKQLFEKYGQGDLEWDQYCGADSDAESLKCAGKATEQIDGRATHSEYLCLGSNLEITGVPDEDPGGNNDAAVKVSGCTWAAGKEAFEGNQMYGRKIKLFGGAATGNVTCTAQTARKGHHILMSTIDECNPYEGMHSPIMAFATIAKLGLNPQDVHLVHAGPLKSPQCKMDAFLEKVIGRGGDSLRLDQESSLCLENVIVPIPAGKSFALLNKGQDDPQAARCSKSPVLLGFADYVRDAFGVKDSFAADAKLRITLPMRKPSPEHPGQYRRHMDNQEELDEALKSSFAELHSGPRFGSTANATADAEAAQHAMLVLLASELRKTGEFEVSEVVPQSMTIEDQVEKFSNTDLLVAPHGAALTWTILLPTCGQVIEFCDGGDFHFCNFAHYAGKPHTCESGPGGWGASSFSANVASTLQTVKRINEEWKKCRAQKV